MNIQCDNCGSEHDLDPPAWVLSSGRPFRFRCSVCGHSQMAQPPTAVQMQSSDEASEPDPATADPTPASPSKTPTTPAPTKPTTLPTPDAGSTKEDEAVFLKQDGKVYLVKDWATLQRWIMERRVGREDLVSEGGVRWEPIGSRPELGSFFAAVEQLEAAELAGLRGNDTPFPTGEGSKSWAFDEPDGDGGPSGLARLDDETEGVPMGMPPLPTEDLDGGTEESAYPDAPPSRLEAASTSPADAAPESPEAPIVAEPALEDTPVPEPEPEPPEPETPAAAPPEEEVDSAFASTVPFVDPSPSMPLFSENDESASFQDTPVFGGREVSSQDLEATDADEDLPPFEEPGVPTEATPELGEAPAVQTMLAPDDEWVEPPEDDDSLAPTEADEDVDEDAAPEEDDFFGEDENTDEFDAHDPFRDFDDAPPPEPIVDSGPPSWLPWVAVAVVTGAVVLALIVAAQRGWFDPAPAEPETPADVQEPPVPQTPETVTPAEDTDRDTGSSDTDATDTDPADTDPADTDASPDTDDAAADVEPDTEADVEPDTQADVEPDTAAPAPPRAPVRNSARSLKNRGWAAMDGGRMSEAEDAFRRAVQTAGGDAEAHLGLGVTLLRQGRDASAKSSLCRAQQLGNTDIKRQASSMLEQAGLGCGP